MRKINQWLESGEHLPKPIRDFHDQKDLFKCIHQAYERPDSPHAGENMPNWVSGQIYVIDWFLWYMAKRGYTLQKSRKKLDFLEFEKPYYPPLNPELLKGDALPQE